MGRHHNRGQHRGRGRKFGIRAGWDMVFNEMRAEREAEARKNDGKIVRVALAGNPNAGKTTLFNAITGQHQHIGNYPGVTVDKKTGYIHHNGWRIEIVDLPGTYSLSAYSLEEVVTRDYVLQDKPDLVVDVLDSSNLERNLYLCLQFQELGVPVIGVLNMMDEVERDGKVIDSEHLGIILGIPFVKAVSNRGQGIDELLDLIVAFAEGERQPANRRINYGREIEKERENLAKVLDSDPEFSAMYPSEWVAVKLLEEDKDAIDKIKRGHRAAQVVLQRSIEARERIRKHFREECIVVVGEQRYAYIHGAVAETVNRIRKVSNRINMTEVLDNIVLNRYAGVFIFFGIMFLVYQLTFAVGNPLSDLIDRGFSLLGGFLSVALPEGAIRDLIVEGIIGGVGGVLIFFPLVMILFMSLAFLEDSGYMSRAAFVMDKFFHLFGLHGRSFIPFMISTGCAVPAVMSARTLVNPRDRKITILVVPILVCGAKSPVIAMLAAAFFPSHSGLVFWLIWLSGWALAFLLALLFRNTIYRGEAAPFVLELPPYRLPTIRGVLSHMWERSWMYVKKAGTVILGISVIVWFLMYFPRLPEQELQSMAPDSLRYGIETVAPESAEFSPEDYQLMHSYAGRIGHFVEPVLKPAGFDWRIGVALFSGFAAKEVIISTMGIVYGVGEADPDAESTGEVTPLKAQLASDPAYSPAMALALMIFVLIYVPCMATMAVVKKELGHWKYPAFLAVYTLLLAWTLSVVVFQVGSLVGL